jgi:hypothetical protein
LSRRIRIRVNSPLADSILRTWSLCRTDRRILGASHIMWTVLVLLILWILSMYYYLPLPVVVLLFAALASAATLAIGVALANRKRVQQAVIKQDAKL